MTEKEILSLTAVQLGKKIKEKEVTCEEALTAVFAHTRNIINRSKTAPFF